MSGQLDHRPSKIIKQLLIDQTLGTDPLSDDDWPIFVDHLPDAVTQRSGSSNNVPVNSICVFNPTGEVQARQQIDGDYAERHGILITVRAESQPIGWAKAHAIVRNMDTVINRTTVTISGSDYLVHDMDRQNDIASLGPRQETRDRVFNIDYLTIITPIP